MGDTIIKIVIADDHQMFLDGLTSLLKDVAEVKVVGTAINGTKALEILDKHEVDMLILDISMPEVGGVELNNIVKQKYPAVKTLALTSHSEPAIISKLTKGKVNGYLLKNAEKSELLEAIFTINRGEQFFSAQVKDKVFQRIFSLGHNDEEPELSKREKEILKLIASENTAQEIADKLFISQHTVNTHRKNLLSKLKVKNIAGLVKYAYENGLL